LLSSNDGRQYRGIREDPSNELPKKVQDHVSLSLSPVLGPCPSPLFGPSTRCVSPQTLYRLCVDETLSALGGPFMCQCLEHPIFA
jgi:hypothetical protein